MPNGDPGKGIPYLLSSRVFVNLTLHLLGGETSNRRRNQPVRQRWRCYKHDLQHDCWRVSLRHERYEREEVPHPPATPRPSPAAAINLNRGAATFHGRVQFGSSALWASRLADYDGPVFPRFQRFAGEIDMTANPRPGGYGHRISSRVGRSPAAAMDFNCGGVIVFSALSGSPPVRGRSRGRTSRPWKIHDGSWRPAHTWRNPRAVALGARIQHLGKKFPLSLQSPNHLARGL